MTNPEKICFGCMQELPAENAVCPFCGQDNHLRVNGPVFLKGSILGGQYLTGKVLGHGGFGITYLGLDLSLDRKVAIKEYFPEGIVHRDPETQHVKPIDNTTAETYKKGMKRAVSEAKLAARMEDIPHVVRIYNVIEANGTVYIVMEFIDGITLTSYVQKSGGKLPWVRAWPIMQPVLQALSKVHGRGIVHRDVSPDNIMIRYADGAPMLLDFGTARGITTGETEHSVSLRLGFSPMELYTSSGAIDQRSDEYAAMATLYYMLTGQKPESPLNVAAGISQVIPPSRSGADLPTGPDGVESVLMRGLACRMEDRYPTIEVMLRAFITAQEQGITMVNPTGNAAAGGINSNQQKPGKKPEEQSKERTSGKKKKGRWIIAIGIVAAIAIIGLLASGMLKSPVPSPTPIETPIETQTEPTPTPTPSPTAEPVTADTLPVGVMLNRYGVTRVNTNVYTDKNDPSSKEKNVSAGEYIYLIMNEPDGIWSHVIVDGQEGYVISEFIYALSEAESKAYNEQQSTPAPFYTVTPEPTPIPTPSPTAEPATADTLPVGVMLNRYGVTKVKTNVYADKEDTGSITKRLSAGEHIYLIMTESNGIWSRVSVDGQEGYMVSKFIYALPEAESKVYDEQQSTPAPVYTKEPRSFELNENVSTNRGRVTISWQDSEDRSPYYVKSQYIGNPDVIQPLYWANVDEERSTTYSKSLTIDQLIPGKTYKIEVEDCAGNSISRIYTLPSPASFTDGLLKASSIGVGISPRWKKASWEYKNASSLYTLHANLIIFNMGTKDYGFRYDINYPQLAYSRAYFTQIAITAPNGYVECEVHDDFKYPSKHSRRYWYIIGSKTFKMIYDQNSTIPTGTWKVDLYWDGMHVNQSTFNVY